MFFLSDFRDKFDEFKEVINKANFIAIDCEFTGLCQDRVQQYDSPSEYFHKICQQTRYYIRLLTDLDYCLVFLLSNHILSFLASPISQMSPIDRFIFNFQRLHCHSIWIHCVFIPRRRRRRKLYYLEIPKLQFFCVSPIKKAAFRVSRRFNGFFGIKQFRFQHSVPRRTCILWRGRGETVARTI